MLNEKAEAAARVASRLRAFEASLDVAILRAAELAGELPQAWSEANISIVVGSGAFERAGQVVSSLMQVRQQTAETHRILDATRAKLDIPELGWGDKAGKPTGAMPLEESASA